MQTIKVKNPYLPHLAKIMDIHVETYDTKTFKVTFDDGRIFDYKPGQFAMLSVFGEGECPISITSSPTRPDYLEFCIRRMGKVTNTIHRLGVGATLGIRGPYGNSFPVEDWKGKNLVFIGGGIGQAPLRSVLLYTLDKRKDYNDITVFYGARSQRDLVFKEELFELEKKEDVDVHLSIDMAELGWKRYVGFVPANVMEVKPPPNNTVAITCGPPIMIKITIQNLLKLGFTDEQIYTTLEMRMKCGIGKCGRCNIGRFYVCRDGPVFTSKQIKNMPPEF